MHSNTRQAVRVDAFGLREMGSERVDAFGLREMVLGKSRQAHQRTIMHSNTRQAANNHALHWNTRQALNASTRSVYAKWYWVNHGRLTSERKAYLPLPIVTHQSLDPAARALKRQASCLLRGLTSEQLDHALEHSTGSEQSCTRTLDRLLTRRRVRSTRNGTG